MDELSNILSYCRQLFKIEVINALAFIPCQCANLNCSVYDTSDLEHGLSLVFKDHLGRAVLAFASQPEIIDDLFYSAGLGEHGPQRVQLAGYFV